MQGCRTKKRPKTSTRETRVKAHETPANREEEIKGEAQEPDSANGTEAGPPWAAEDTRTLLSVLSSLGFMRNSRSTSRAASYVGKSLSSCVNEVSTRLWNSMNQFRSLWASDCSLLQPGTLCPSGGEGSSAGLTGLLQFSQELGRQGC